MKTTIIYLILLLGLFHQIKAQTISIPDANFESKLISLGIDSDGLVNGQISTADAQAVRNTLRLTSSGITNLTGIQAFTNLTGVICDSNQISTIDVSATNLSLLWCGNNQLTSITLPTSGTMVNFICNGNQLTSLDVSGQLNLEFLWCVSNQISTLNLTNNLVLENLACEANQLTALDVSNNTRLDHLSFSDNQVSSINLMNNNRLRYLYVQDNPLNGSLDISNNLNLITLNCGRTGMNTIDVTNHLALQVLDISDNHFSALDLSNNISLSYLNFAGNLFTNIDLVVNVNLNRLISHGNRSYLRMCIPSLTMVNNFWRKDVTAVYTVGCGQYAVEVEVVVDSNNNCIADTTEMGLFNQVVRFERQSDGLISYFSTYGNTGTYPFYIDTGSYIVNVTSPNPYWTMCPNTQVFTVDTATTLQEIDFTMTPNIICPLLEVDIAAPFLRPTAGGSAYTVSYCNKGTAIAQNAYVEVDLDIDLNLISSTLPIVSQVANTYRFNVGNIESGDCGSFDLQVIVDTSAIISQTHCTQVHIYPDSICLPSFNLPMLKGEVFCQNDTVFFALENTGVNMLQTQRYEIFEDNIAMRTGVVQLNNGQSITIPQAANIGHTYRIEVEQAPNYPAILGDPTFLLVIEGCRPRPNGSFNTGFITQFSNGLSQPSQAIDCQQNIAAYDPNDKVAQPLGYDSQHYIDTATIIDYKVRFQNTGTDTAFNITILDTLSSFVDPASIRMGSSSHTYNWQLLNGNVLQVNFPDILLVDSNANEPLSHGFFRYRIEQQPNNALGSVIYNQAAIYFDYNPPIFTNTTYHTIGEDFVTKIYLSVEEVLDDELEVLVYPNPFEVSTTIVVEGAAFEVLEIQVFDLLGRQVASEQVHGSNQIKFEKGNLETGTYIYRLLGDDKLISTGKVRVE